MGWVLFFFWSFSNLIFLLTLITLASWNNFQSSLFKTKLLIFVKSFLQWISLTLPDENSNQDYLAQISWTEIFENHFFGKHEILQDVNSLHVKMKKYSEIIINEVSVSQKNNFPKNPIPKPSLPKDLLWIFHLWFAYYFS